MKEKVKKIIKTNLISTTAGLMAVTMIPATPVFATTMDTEAVETPESDESMLEPTSEITETSAPESEDHYVSPRDDSTAILKRKNVITESVPKGDETCDVTFKIIGFDKIKEDVDDEITADFYILLRNVHNYKEYGLTLTKADGYEKTMTLPAAQYIVSKLCRADGQKGDNFIFTSNFEAPPGEKTVEIRLHSQKQEYARAERNLKKYEEKAAKKAEQKMIVPEEYDNSAEMAKSNGEGDLNMTENLKKTFSWQSILGTLLSLTVAAFLVKKYKEKKEKEKDEFDEL